MFKKKPNEPAEMDVSDCHSLLANSREFFRMWAQADGPITCLIDPGPVGSDPFALGIALADCVRHGAKAFSRAFGIPESEAEARIWEGLDAERGSPTDQPTDLSDKGTLN